MKKITGLYITRWFNSTLSLKVKIFQILQRKKNLLFFFFWLAIVHGTPVVWKLGSLNSFTLFPRIIASLYAWVAWLDLLSVLHISGFQSSSLTLSCCSLFILWDFFFVLLKPQIQIVFLKDSSSFDGFLNTRSQLQIISPTIPARSFSTEMGFAFGVRCNSWQKEDTLGKLRDMVSVQVCCTLTTPWAIATRRQNPAVQLCPCPRWEEMVIYWCSWSFCCPAELQHTWSSVSLGPRATVESAPGGLAAKWFKEHCTKHISDKVFTY